MGGMGGGVAMWGCMERLTVMRMRRETGRPAEAPTPSSSWPVSTYELPKTGSIDISTSRHPDSQATNE